MYNTFGKDAIFFIKK